MNANSNMEISKTQRGGQKILFDGYAYIKDKIHRENQYWRCDKKHQCRARLTTDIDSSAVLRVTNHNHAPCPASNISKKVVSEIRETAKNSQECTSVLVNRTLQQFPLAAAGSLPKKNTLTRMVCRLRQTDDVPNTTTRGESFISLNEEDLLILTTIDNLNLLRASLEWFCDGTFDSAPTNQQLYTIHAVVDGTRTLPMVYCICDHKNDATYNRIFEHSKEKRPDLDPSSVTVDFEIAAINAIQHAYPNAQISGCYFHFCQASFRKLQTLGLQTWYAEKADNSLLIKSFQVV